MTIRLADSRSDETGCFPTALRICFRRRRRSTDGLLPSRFRHLSNRHLSGGTAASWAWSRTSNTSLSRSAIHSRIAGAADLACASINGLKAAMAWRGAPRSLAAARKAAAASAPTSALHHRPSSSALG